MTSTIINNVNTENRSHYSNETLRYCDTSVTFAVFGYKVIVIIINTSNDCFSENSVNEFSSSFQRRCEAFLKNVKIRNISGLEITAMSLTLINV